MKNKKDAQPQVDPLIEPIDGYMKKRQSEDGKNCMISTYKIFFIYEQKTYSLFDEDVDDIDDLDEQELEIKQFIEKLSTFTFLNAQRMVTVDELG